MAVEPQIYTKNIKQSHNVFVNLALVTCHLSGLHLDLQQLPGRRKPMAYMIYIATNTTFYAVYVLPCFTYLWLYHVYLCYPLSCVFHAFSHISDQA